MASKPRTFAGLVDQVEFILDDAGNATWSAARLGALLNDAITEVSGYVPFVMKDTYTIESRTGSATSTSPGNLVDATNAHFVLADTGKVVFNTKDKTWAVITSHSSTTQVGLSSDIMASGEGYEIYNKGCFSKKQINIEDSHHFLWILHAVYPSDRSGFSMPFNQRNFWLLDQNKILEIDVATVGDSSVATSWNEVDIYFAKEHRVNDMTDLAGAANAAISAGATTTTIKDLTDADSYVYKDSLFTVALALGISSRQTYRVTEDAAISSNAATVKFYPAMEAAIDISAIITFISSTLTPELERLIVQIVAGEALMSEGTNNINQIPKGGWQVSTKRYDMGERIAEKARSKLRGKVDVDLRATHVYSRG